MDHQSLDMENVIQSVIAYVQARMQKYDASHDFDHVDRVCRLAERLLELEKERGSPCVYDIHIVKLGSLLHDVHDKKYVKEETETIKDILVRFGATEMIANKVQIIVSNISYSTEIRESGKIQSALLEVPELAVVQDADRLEALGAIGIGRAFAFGGAMYPNEKLSRTLNHFSDKLESLETMMKTESGKSFAKIRTTRLRQFRDWWIEETSVINTTPIT